MGQLFFAGKAYLKINSLVKTPLHKFMAVERSGLWAPAFRPHSNGVFGRQKCRFSETEMPAYRFRVDRRKQRFSKMLTSILVPRARRFLVTWSSGSGNENC